MKPHNMSLKEQFNFLVINMRLLLLSTLLCGLFGVLAHFLLPPSYSAVGYFYISRAVSMGSATEPLPQEFIYEGYYARQNAVSYVPTFLGLIESDSTSRAVLESMQQPATAAAIRKFERSVSVKKPAPQLIELSYKASSPDYALEVWKTLARHVVEKHYDLNANIDPNISVKYLADDPVVEESYRNPALSLLVSSLLGFGVTLFVLAFKFHMSSQQ